MGSSAQNSSGVHWCRCRLRSNDEVPEKVPQVPEKVWEALVQSQVRFNRVPEKVPEKVWEASVQSQVKFNRVPEKVPQKVWEALVQSQVRFNKVQQGEGLGDFGAEPGQVQQRVGEGSGEGLGGFGAEPGKVQQMVQSQVRCNRVPEKVWEALVHRLASQHASERFVEVKRCGCWGYHRSLFTLHSTLYTPHFTLYTPHSTLHAPHFTLHSTLYTLHATLHM